MKNTKILASTLIALASVAATSAFAGNDNDYPVLPAATSHLTRAQVLAELAQARQDGTLLQADDGSYPVIKPTGTPKTRAEVRAETAAAFKDGSLNIRGDYHG